MMIILIYLIYVLLFNHHMNIHNLILVGIIIAVILNHH